MHANGKVLETETPRFGRPPKLGRADQVLIALVDWQEYQKKFNITQHMVSSKPVFTGPSKKLSMH